MTHSDVTGDGPPHHPCLFWVSPTSRPMVIRPAAGFERVNDTIDPSKVQAGKIELVMRLVVVSGIFQVSPRFIKEAAQPEAGST